MTNLEEPQCESPLEAGDYADLNLLPQHQQQLQESAISPKVAKERAYWSATKKRDLKDLGFSERQCRVPALVMPIYNVLGEIISHQIRPDNPRAGKDGRIIKYETPTKARLALDVPPAVRETLADPKVILFITEGAKKADSAVSHGLFCLALLGVFGWRGTNRAGGRIALPDWELIALNGRPIYIVFDSDVAVKPEVSAALIRLKNFLELRGATVRIIYLPSRRDGGKVGLDDFFAAGGTTDDLLSFATETVREPAEAEREGYTHPYIEKPEGIFLCQAAFDSSGPVPLTNFTA
ncbi:MAG: DUF3854 domain-containing protein [Candidatus Binatia bacterium]